MKKIMKTMLAFAAVLLCGGAWAAAPVVWWSGDFGTSAKVGTDGVTYVLNPNGNTVDADGNLVIDSTASGGYGALVKSSDGNFGQNVSILIKYSGLVAPTDTCYSLFGVRDTSTANNGLGNGVGVCLNGNGAAKVAGCVEGGALNSTALAAHASSGYMLFCYSTQSGAAVYSGSDLSSLAGGAGSGLHYSNLNIKTLGVGGPVSSMTYPAWNNLKIEEVAIFRDCAAVSSFSNNNNLSTTYLNGMTKPELAAVDVFMFNKYLTSEWQDTGYKLTDIDALAKMTFFGEMAGGNIGNSIHAASGWHVTKQADDTVTFEMQTYDGGYVKIVPVSLKIENGTVRIKGGVNGGDNKLAAYFNQNKPLGTRAYAADFSARLSTASEANLGSAVNASDSYAVASVFASSIGTTLSVQPVASWTDFTGAGTNDGVKKNGVTLKANGNSVAADGITIDGSTGGAMVTFDSALDSATVVVKYTGAITAESFGAVAMKSGSTEGGVWYDNSDSKLKGYWGKDWGNANVVGSISSGANEEHTLVYSYGRNKGYVVAGSWLYIDGRVVYGTASLTGANATINSFSIGGFSGTTKALATGMKITSITVYNTAVKTDDTNAGQFLKYWYEFNGNLNKSSREGVTIGGENGDSYVDLGNGNKGYSTVDGGSKHPYGTLTLPSDGYTVVSRLRSVATENSLLWSLGNTTTDHKAIGLISRGSDKIALYEYGSSVSYIIDNVVVPNATTSFHDYAITVCGTTVELFVDGVSKGSKTLTNAPTAKFQWGGVHGGTTEISGLTRTSGVVIDDWKLYESVLRASELPTGVPIATIGQAGYSTLAAALEAAKAGETVTLIANTKEDVTIPAEVTVGTTDANKITGTINGAGTIVCDGWMPSSSNITIGDNWTGVVHIKNKNGSAIPFTSLGRTGSVIRFTNVAGWANQYTCNAIVDLVDGENGEVAFTHTGANQNATYEFAGLSGAGTFKMTVDTSDGYTRPCYFAFADVSGFTGSIDTQRPVIVGANSGTTDDHAKIVIASTQTTLTAKSVSSTPVSGVDEKAVKTVENDDGTKTYSLVDPEAKIVEGDSTQYFDTVQAAIDSIGAEGDIGKIQIVGNPTIPSGYRVNAERRLESIYGKWTDVPAMFTYSGSDANFHKGHYIKFDLTTGSEATPRVDINGDGRVAANTLPEWTTAFDKGWYLFCSSTGDNGRYNRTYGPGYALRFAGTEGAGAKDASFNDLTFGGMIVEEGAVGWSITNNGSIRTTYLGDGRVDDEAVETWFVYNENFEFNRGPLSLRGEINIDIANGKTLSLNTANGNGNAVTVDATTAANVKFHGAGQLAVKTLNAKGAVTLDYTDVACDSSAFINGTLAVDANTVIKLPAGAQVGSSYKLATTAITGTIDDANVLVGGEEMSDTIHWTISGGMITATEATSVASINGVEFKSLTKAIAAASEGQNKTVKLLTNVEGDSRIVPSGVIIDLDGHNLTGSLKLQSGAYILEGTGDNKKVKINGIATSFDVTFNTKDTADTNGHIDYQCLDYVRLQYDSVPSYTNETTTAGSKMMGVYLKHHPYIHNLENNNDAWFNATEEITLAVVGMMPKKDNTVFLHMGRSATKNGLFLATGDEDEEVVICYNKLNTIKEIDSLKVPNARTARHTYIVTKHDDPEGTPDRKTTFVIWLDGEKIKTVKFDHFTITGGVQVGKPYGSNFSGWNNVEANAQSENYDGESYINVIRMYDRVISETEIRRYSDPDEYPYNSPNGTYQREFTSAQGQCWKGGDGAWTSSVESEHEAGVAVPVKGLVIANFTADASINVNQSEETNYEKLSINGPAEGSATVTFAKSEGSTAIKALSTTINTPIILADGTIDLTEGPTKLGENGRVTFDFSSLTAQQIVTDGNLMRKVTGVTDKDVDMTKFSIKKNENETRLAISLSRNADDECVYVSATVTPLNVYYVSAYFNADVSGDHPTLKLQDGTVVSYDKVLSCDTVVIRDTTDGQVGCGDSLYFAPTGFKNIKVERDIIFKSGSADASLGGSTITIADGKTLTFQVADYDINLGEVTINKVSTEGAGVVAFASSVSATAIAGDATLMLAEGATLTVGTALSEDRVVPNDDTKKVKKVVNDNSTVTYSVFTAVAKIGEGEDEVFYATYAEAIAAAGDDLSVIVVLEDNPTMPTGYVYVDSHIYKAQASVTVYEPEDDMVGITTYYKTLAQAVEAYEGGDLALESDIVMAETFVFNKDVGSFNPNGHTITSSDSSVTPVKIAAGSMLVQASLTGGISNADGIAVEVAGNFLSLYSSISGRVVLDWDPSKELRAQPTVSVNPSTIVVDAKPLVKEYNDTLYRATLWSEDDTVEGFDVRGYAIVDISPVSPTKPTDEPVVVTDSEEKVAMEPGADVSVPTDMPVENIKVVYGGVDLAKEAVDAEGEVTRPKYVEVSINETTGAVELTTTEAAKPAATAIAMSTPTDTTGETPVDEVAFTITDPIPGLFYAVSACDTPDGDFESATGDQATSSAAKTVSIPMTFSDGKKVKFYKVSVKATK